jgi:hypothetical protein
MHVGEIRSYEAPFLKKAMLLYQMLLPAQWALWTV